MLVFAPQATERLNYILDYLLIERMGISYKLTDNIDYFKKSQNFKINYSNAIEEGCLNIPLEMLLFEENICLQKIETNADKKWHKTFYNKAYNPIPDFKFTTQYLSFDILAASFYLISRYEEYLPSKKDKHQRFKASNSLAFKENFLETPLLDIWVENLKNVLLILYPNLQIKESHFQQINTIDVDFAYKYIGQSPWALTRKFFGSILKGKPDFNCLSKTQNDPYNTYDYLIATAKIENFETLFFLLLADYGGYDKNISPKSMAMANLVKALKMHNTCGIHPSYRANLNGKKFQQEFAHFENLTAEKAQIARQHFLKLNLPSTYEKLEKAGIQNDYTMAYADAIGFRASTCFPFPFFNLIENKLSKLRVHPSCLMDVVLKNQLLLTPAEAIEKIKQLKAAVKTVNGQFISIWHNSSFDETQGWKDWKEVYQSLFE